MDVKALYTSIPNNEGIAAVQRKQDNYTKKTVATKVITTFLALILTLNNFIFNSSFTFKSKAVLWEQYAPLHTQTYSCERSKRNTTLSFKTNPEAICALSTIYLWYGPNQRTNLKEGGLSGRMT